MKEKVKEIISWGSTWKQKLLHYFVEFLFQYPGMAIGALIGGISILTFVDSLFKNLWNIPLPLPPMTLLWLPSIDLRDYIYQVFTFFRGIWRPLTEFIEAIFSLELPSSIKDYITMGLITASMRIRSSFIIWRGVNDKSLNSYSQKTILANKPVVLYAGEWCKFLLLFLPIRVIYAFFAWPLKIVGAAVRFNNRYLTPSSTGEPEFTGKAKEVRKLQYMAFFTNIISAVAVLLFVHFLAFAIFVFHLIWLLF